MMVDVESTAVDRERLWFWALWIRRARALVVVAAILGVALAGSARTAEAQEAGTDQYDSGDAPSGLMTEVTGTLERLDPATYGYGEYKIVDEASGGLYALDDGEAGILEPYVGQRVTVTGTEPAAGDAPQNPRLLNVMQVEPAGEAPEGPGNTGSITFEVDTQGKVPAGTEFFGVYGEPTNPYGEIPPFSGLGVVGLHDSDGDGTYTGVSDVPLGKSLALIATGDARGPEQKIYPQSIVQRDATITVDGNETVSTTVTFPKAPADPAGPGDSTGGNTKDGNTGGGGSGAPSPGEGGAGIAVLPDTGGPLTLAAAGLALAGAGAAALGLLASRRR